MNPTQLAQSFNDLETVTNYMTRMEAIVNREQKYIAAHGASNDANPDKQWEMYKETAQFHLDTWDALKARRDQLKAEK